MLKSGVIYIATGDNKYIDEAIKSTLSLKKHNPDISVALLTDMKKNINIFDEQILITDASHTFKDKIFNLEKSPYDSTLFLDTDTYICSSIEELFELSLEYDLALAHAPKRITQDYLTDFNHIKQTNIPKSFPEFNTGVMLFNKNKKFSKMIEECKYLYKKYSQDYTVNLPDQIVFREAVYGSNISISTLTPEYNCRFIFPTYVEGEIKILHGRSKNIDKLSSKFNKYLEPRVILPGIGILSSNNYLFKGIKKLKNIFQD